MSHALIVWRPGLVGSQKVVAISRQRDLSGIEQCGHIRAFVAQAFQARGPRQTLKGLPYDDLKRRRSRRAVVGQPF
jgi:hypothetical protein